MMFWYETKEAKDWIATGDARYTSTESMKIIALMANDLDEAERIWNRHLGGVCSPRIIHNNVTQGGRHDPEDFVWGAHGSAWRPAIKGE